MATDTIDSDNPGDGDEHEASSLECRFPCPNPRTQRYLVAVEYVGTKFSGSQKQNTGRTVVGVLEEAFLKFIGHPVLISLSSRTDVGVHALFNVCHVDVERRSKRKPNEILPPHEPGVVKKAINHFLQKYEGDIMVVDVLNVSSEFHARFDAKERTYFYHLIVGPEPISVFEKDRAWHVREELDLKAMQRACDVLVGCHDFSSFRSSGCQAKSPIKTLYELSISEVVSVISPRVTSADKSTSNNEDSQFFLNNSLIDSVPAFMRATCSGNMRRVFRRGRSHRHLVVTARAHSFLYRQVRLLVGTLKDVGAGAITVSEVSQILEAKSVCAARPMAPACGLYLGHVKYDL